MYHETVDKAKEKMKKSCDVLQRDLLTLRAGRANPQILDKIMVDYYGTMTALKQVANISVPEPRVLQISVFEQKMLAVIEKAIQKSDVGINPTNDGKVLRLVVPELNEERRKELGKQVKKFAEESKVAVRSIRRDAVDHVKKMKKDSIITEDDMKKAETELQKITDAATQEIDKLAAEKEKEILQV